MSIFSQKLRELREINSLSMKELAKIINVSDCAISNWENDINEPKATYLFALSKYFNVSVDYLLGIEDDFGNISVNNNTGLTENEKRLLKAFNVLDDIEQEKLIEDAEFYASRSSAVAKFKNINNQ